MRASRDSVRILALAGISLGVAFIVIYLTASPHQVYRLIFGIGFIALGLVNLDAVRRSRR